MRTYITSPGRAQRRRRWGSTVVSFWLVALVSAVACVDRDVAGPDAAGSLTSVVSAVGGGAQIFQTGIECGCTKVGPYVTPAQGKTIAVTQEGASPHNTYQVTATQIGGTVNLRINRGATVVVQYTVPIGASWGFSPDDDRFVYHYVTGTAPNQVHNVFLYNLTASPSTPVTSFAAATGASQIVFSPRGKQLMYAYLVGTNLTSLTVVDAVTGATRYQTTFNFQSPPGSPGNTFGMASWGFSPDAGDRTFVYVYITGQASAQWDVVNLAGSPALVNSETAGAGFWRFSPCGDMLGVVRQSGSQLFVSLKRTIDGTQVPGSSQTAASGATITFSVTLANHVVTVGTTATNLALNTADDPCQVPGPTLSTLTLNPTSLQGGGTSTGTVTLSGAALSGGLTVTLASSNTLAATVPSSVTVVAGSSSASFVVQTKSVTSSTPATISAVAGGVTKTAVLTVTAPPPPVRTLSLSPSSLNFGNQQVATTSGAQQITVSSTGNMPVTISGIIATGPFAKTSTCPVSPATLNAGVSCTITVTFTPPSVGAQSGTVTVTSDATTSPNVATLSGTGYIAAPGVSFSATSIDFGGVKLGLNPSYRTLTITSTGTAPLVVSSSAIGGANAWDFNIDTDTCSGATLNPGATCAIRMFFDPFNTGTRLATLTVSHNAGGSPSVVALKGTGLSPGPVQP